MMIPNADRAFISPGKIEGYSLNMEHDDGQHKARVFASALGITQDNAEVLYSALYDAVKNYEAQPGDLDRYGQRFTIDFELTTEKGSAIIRSGWIIRIFEDFPRLVTAYIYTG